MEKGEREHVKTRLKEYRALVDGTTKLIDDLGGLVGGLAMGWLVSLERRDPDRFMPVWKAAAWLCLLATVAAFAMVVLHAY